MTKVIFGGVYDAFAPDGRKYALKLHPDTLAIIQSEPDDD
jgi:hypothetical protein